MSLHLPQVRSNFSTLCASWILNAYGSLGTNAEGPSLEEKSEPVNDRDLTHLQLLELDELRIYPADYLFHRNLSSSTNPMLALKKRIKLYLTNYKRALKTESYLPQNSFFLA